MRSSFVPPGLRRAWPALVPLVLAVVALGFGQSLRALVLGAIGAAVLILAVIGVDVAGWVRPVIRGIGTVVWSVVFVVMVVPTWAVSKARRRGPLGADRRPGWAIAAAGAAPQSLGSPSSIGGPRRRLAGRIAWALGCVVILLSANYGLGLAWDTLRGNDSPATSSSVGVLQSAAPAVKAGRPISTAKVARDPRNDSPAMAKDPWREVYFRDLQVTMSTYWPYTEDRPLAFRSEYINIGDWARRSYEPPHVNSSTMPTVWMFGGSTTFGEGQRDRETIASWLSRLAQAAGTPIDITNYGQRGWTHFQELLLYEQQLASHRSPAFSLFYDGANETTAQSLMTEAVPTHTQALAYAQKLGGLQLETQVAAPPKADVLGDLWRAYEKHSVVAKIVNRLGLGSTSAGAQPADDPTSPQDPNRGYQTHVPRVHGQVTVYNTTLQDAKNAVKVYDDGRRMTLDLSRDYGVRSLLFWQPVADHGPIQQWPIDHLSPPTIDLSSALDGHRDDYIDAVHTNEEGARLVALAIWAHLQPEITQWYRTHP